MQQKMLRTSMATNLQCRRLRQGGAAASGGAPVQFSGSVLAAPSHRFAFGEHELLDSGFDVPPFQFDPTNSAARGVN